MQEDGNFTLSKDNKVLWSTGTEGKKGKKLIMQEDGNLVISDRGNNTIWSTNIKRS